MTNLKIHLLGSPMIQLGDELIEFDTRKAIALLAYLALAKGPQSRTTLAAMLWPGSNEARARSALRRTLAALNKGIGKGWIAANRSTIELVRSPDLFFDVDYFRSVAKSIRPEASGKVDCERVLPRLEEGLDLYRGGFLEGFTLNDSAEFDEWQSWQARRLSHEISKGFSLLLSCCEQLNNWETAVSHARRWVQQDPLHEPAHRAMMRIYALTGKRSAAIQQYETCARLLDEELGIEPQEETQTLYEAIVAGEVAPSQVESQKSLTPVMTNLPRQLTSFVGRQKEMGEINRLLEDSACRLVTIVGPGGMGKTRLALEAASSRLERYKHGVFFVGLGPISAAEFLIPTIAEALSFSFSGAPGDNEVLKRQLLDHLREKQMLLVIDNFEHLLEGADLLAEILQRAPHIQMLVTSQQRLNLMGEWLIEIQGLECPNGTGDNISASSAVTLFVQRANQVTPDFSLTEAQKPHVARICELVGGLPLGIELAATWVRLLSCHEIAQQIEESLDFLAVSLRDLPDRHRSLRAVFEHSWRLLSDEERQLFRALSVFHGGFRSEAAGQVAPASLPLLLSLVNKSLLLRSDSSRFEINQVLHQYALEKFRELSDGERGVINGRHGLYYAHFLQERAQALRGAGQSDALREIGNEVENVRRSWRWAVEQADLEALELIVDPLYRFYEMRSWFQEGADAFEYALDLIKENPDVDPLLLGRLLSRRGRLLLRLSRQDEGRQAIEQALELLPLDEAVHERVAVLSILGVTAEMAGNTVEARQRQEDALILAEQIDDHWGMANALLRLGNVVYGQGEYEDARHKYRQSLDLWRQLDDRRGISVCLNNLGSIADTLGEYEDARQLYEESLEIKEELGDRRGMAYSFNNSGYVKCLLGELDKAEEDLEKSIALFQEIGDRKGISYALVNLGNIAFSRGNYAEAEKFFQEGWEYSRDINFKLGLAFSQYHLGATALRQGYESRARDCLMESLSMAKTIKALPVILEILVEIANLLMHENYPARAAAILQAVRRHPSSRRHVRDDADALWHDLKEKLGGEIEAVEPIELENTAQLEKFIAPRA